MSARTTSTTSRFAGPRWSLVWAALLSLGIWFVPGAGMALYPLRIFVTLVHEGGHALATVLTGGQVDHIAVYANANGVTLSRGGWVFLVYMAGYLGATLFGASALLMSRRKGSGKRGLVLMAAVVLLITGLWVHPWINPFGFLMGLIVAGLLLMGARLLPERAAAFAFSFLAVQLCLNAVFDLRDLLWLTTNTRAPNDAVFMAQTFGLTPWFWASAWALGASVILFAALRTYWRAR